MAPYPSQPYDKHESVGSDEKRLEIYYWRQIYCWLESQLMASLKCLEQQDNATCASFKPESHSCASCALSIGPCASSMSLPLAVADANIFVAEKMKIEAQIRNYFSTLWYKFYGQAGFVGFDSINATTNSNPPDGCECIYHSHTHTHSTICYIITTAKTD